MSVPSRKTVFIVDAMAFRRARSESFLTQWARNEQADLVSLDPEAALSRLAKRCACDMLIYSARAACAPELITEIQALHMICCDTALAIICDDERPATVVAAIRSGAKGYFSNSMPPELALQALSFVLRGGTYFPPAAIMSGQGSEEAPYMPGQETALFERHSPLFEARAQAAHPGFTERQHAVLVGLCQGDPNKVIGRKLGMTETTVKVHVREIMRKLGVCNRTQVAIAAGRGGVVAEGAGLVPSDSPLPIKSTVQ